jgi:WD40 repeat protein
VSVTPDGRRAVSASHDKTLRVWDLHSGQCLTIYQAGDHVLFVTIAPLGDRIVCGTWHGQMHFLTPRNFEQS